MAHRDIVIVPCYFRPEFLHLCLENLYICPEMLDKDVWVCQDIKYDDLIKFKDEMYETERVLEYWKRGFGNRLKAIRRPENGFYGNSYNVLSAYVKAYETDAKYVYLVEEDVFVTPDFFRWHEAVQVQEDFFCTIAGKSECNPVSFEGQIAGAYFRSEHYRSLGVCWKRENLREITQHAELEYYRNSAPYIIKHFPNSPFGLGMMEQDGLIQRIMAQTFQIAAWACLPRAYHVGVYGYHRGIGKDNMFVGTLPERTEMLRKAVADPEWLKKVASFQIDVQSFPPSEIPSWEKVFPFSF
jgi:hypothetical protein